MKTILTVLVCGLCCAAAFGGSAKSFTGRSSNKQRATNGSYNQQKSQLTETKNYRQRTRKVVSQPISATPPAKIVRTPEEEAEWQDLKNWLLDLREKRIRGEITQEQFDEQRKAELERREALREAKRDEAIRKKLQAQNTPRAQAMLYAMDKRAEYKRAKAAAKSTDTEPLTPPEPAAK